MPTRSIAPRQNRVACVPCRVAKLRCSHHNQPPCDRCRAYGRAEACYFPQKWTSAIHRQPKRPRRDSHSQQVHQTVSADSSAHVASNDGDSVRPNRPRVPDFTLIKDDRTETPLEWLTEDVKLSYLRCTYKWCFHHKPKLLQQIETGKIEPAMAWAILALASRYCPAPPGFTSSLEASNYFAQHAARCVQLGITSPSLSQIQSLLLLTGHNWGAGDGKSAWIYLGIAIRMIQMMGLCSESCTEVKDVPASDLFISAEERRRTAWTCFLMESLLSGGGNRARILTPDDMTIQLPCEDEHFVFGSPVECELLNGTFSRQRSSHPTSTLGILAYTVRIADTWGDVAKWASSNASFNESPSNPESTMHSLVSSLEHWKMNLPDRLRYSAFSLQAHSVFEKGQAFCYMHSIYFMSMIFLHRNFLPRLELSKTLQNLSLANGENGVITWQGHSSQTLYDTASTVCDMCREINHFGVDFRRGLVPWIGFTVYTTIGVMLYFEYFPAEPGSGESLREVRDKLASGYVLLKQMKHEWPMASRWLENIHSLRKFYAFQSTGAKSSPEELQNIRSIMVDYGALHEVPISRTTDTPEFGNSSDANEISPLGTSEASNNSLSVDVSDLLDDFDQYNEMGLEGQSTNIFQEFWTMFPGEFGTDMSNE